MFGQKRLSREGGIEIVVKELCTRMARDGCQVTCYNRSGHHVSGAEYTWYGMTYHEDVAAVKDSFKKMLENGVYKADLFSDL